MNDFKLEVGGHCANGAKVIALFMNESEGATWTDREDCHA